MLEIRNKLDSDISQIVNYSINKKQETSKNSSFNNLQQKKNQNNKLLDELNKEKTENTTKNFPLLKSLSAPYGIE